MASSTGFAATSVAVARGTLVTEPTGLEVTSMELPLYVRASSIPQLIAKGMLITWVGCANSCRDLLVRGVRADNSDIWLIVRNPRLTQTAKQQLELVVLREQKHAPNKGRNCPLDCLREGATHGICPGGNGLAEMSNRVTPDASPSRVHICGYDIEQEAVLRFATRSEHSICASAFCSCGAVFICHSYLNGDQSTKCPVHNDLKDEVKAMEVVHTQPDGVLPALVSWIVDHRPHFIVGHNSMLYDNQCIVANLARLRKPMGVPISISTSGATVLTVLNVVGISEIDTFAYLDKIHHDGLESMSLAACAIRIGYEKQDSEAMTLELPREKLPRALAYNLHDSWLAVKVLLKSGAFNELMGLGLVGACMLDSVRFVPGAMNYTAICRYLLGTGRYIEPGHVPTHSLDYFLGAYNFHPIPGVYSDVYAVDFGSMYPRICIDSLMSPDKLAEVPKSRWESVWEEIGVELSESGVFIGKDRSYVHIGGKLFTSSPGLVQEYVTFLINFRKKVGKATDFGWSVKVLTNALYGAFGAQHSPLFSPHVAATIPATGRAMSVTLTYSFTIFGFKRVYGDTDSGYYIGMFPNCRMSRGSVPDVTNRAFEDAVSFTNSLMEYIGVTSILEIENGGKPFTTGVLVKPKMYVLANGVEISKLRGLAPVRGDRSRYSKVLTLAILRGIVEMHNTGLNQRQRNLRIANIVREVDKMVANSKDQLSWLRWNKRRAVGFITGSSSVVRSVAIFDEGAYNPSFLHHRNASLVYIDSIITLLGFADTGTCFDILVRDSDSMNVFG